MRVHVRAEPHAERLHERGDVLPGEVPGAVEAHVLDEVRQTPLVVVFEHRAGLDHEPQFGATPRLPVRTHVVAQTVRQPADPDLRVDINDLGERVPQRAAGRGRRLGTSRVGQHRDGGNRENQATLTCTHESFLIPDP